MTDHRARTGIAVSALILAAFVAPHVLAQASTPKAPSAPRHTAADVEFMQGMIAHHAQALVMAAMAPTHGASPRVSLFCRKILRSQRDEIELMQSWLHERGERVPDPNAPHAGMHMGMDMSMGDHEMLMPGMLTAEQLTRLDQARDTSFDRLFLTFMIQHHEGAITMVAKLFSSPGAGQEAEIFGYATGVDADQRAEIERMQGMLAGLGHSVP
jgi:uncharacterized protein (DUF305 family)